MDPNNSTGNCLSRNRRMRQWTKQVVSISRMIYFNFLKFQPNFYWIFYYFSNPECKFIGNFRLWSCGDKNTVTTNKEVNWKACVMFISFLSLCSIIETNTLSVEKIILNSRNILPILHTSYFYAVQKHCFQYTMCLA